MNFQVQREFYAPVNQVILPENAIDPGILGTMLLA